MEQITFRVKTREKQEKQAQNRTRTETPKNRPTRDGARGVPWLWRVAPTIVYTTTFLGREGRGGGRGDRPLLSDAETKQKSVAVPLRDEVGLDRAVFAAADDLPVLPAAAESLPLVSLGAVQRQRGADVPELYRAVLGAAQHLRARNRRKTGDDE